MKIVGEGAPQDPYFHAQHQEVLQPPAQPGVVVAPQTVVAPPVVAPVNQGCDCRVPEGARSEVKMMRALSIAVIVAHALALLIFGFWNPYQYVASLCGIIAGGVLLCCYQKGVYVCTPIVYIVAAVFDLVAAISWLLYTSSAGFVAIFPILALIVSIPGIVCGFRACQSWDESSGVTKAHAGPIVSVAHHSPPPMIIHEVHQPQAMGYPVSHV